MTQRTLTQEDFDQWVKSAHDGDPDAALRIAMFLLSRACIGHPQEGDDQAIASWLEHAAGLHGPPMMWRIAEMAKEYSYDIADRWQRAAVAAEWRDSDVEVEQDAFCLVDFRSWVSQDFAVRVTGEPDDAVREALSVAAPRLCSVGNDGVEYEDGEVAVDAADYNPNYASDPHPHADGGWEVWLDCKGEAFPLMAGTMLRILADELRQAGVRSARIGPSRDPVA